MTDEEFIIAIQKFGIDILYQKARELIKRPATKAQQVAYERNLELRKQWNRNNRKIRK